MIRHVSEFTVRALLSGNSVIDGDRRYEPLGDASSARLQVPPGLHFTSATGACHERDGRMRMFDSSGVIPADRIGFFGTGRWLRWIGCVGPALALWVEWCYDYKQAVLNEMRP